MKVDILQNKLKSHAKAPIDKNLGFVLPPLGSLVASKAIVVSNNSNYFAVERHFFYEIMRYQIEKIQFDEDWYLKNYPDVGAAIKSGTVKQAYHHYTRFGYFEHRLPRDIKVDESWYLDTYPDVREAIARGNYSSAQDHFMLSGFSEGRLPFIGFVL